MREPLRNPKEFLDRIGSNERGDCEQADEIDRRLVALAGLGQRLEWSLMRILPRFAPAAAVRS